MYSNWPSYNHYHCFQIIETDSKKMLEEHVNKVIKSKETDPNEVFYDVYSQAVDIGGYKTVRDNVDEKRRQHISFSKKKFRHAIG